MRITRLVDVTLPALPAERQAALVALNEQLSSILPDREAEVWVTLVDYPRLCALIDGQQGWMLLLRHACDEGLHSVNPEYGGPAGARSRFRLSNGQEDEYPAAWCYAAPDVLEALEFFARESRVPDWIQWEPSG